VLGTYVSIVARLRRSQPGTPIALRADDVVALSSALGQPAEHVEQRIVEMLGCTAHEAHSLHSEMLRRKLVVPVAGLVAGLAVVTGVAASGALNSSPSTPGTAHTTPVVRVIDVTPTAAEVAATRATLPADAEPPSTVVATIPVAAKTPEPAPAPAAAPAPAPTAEPAPAATPAPPAEPEAAEPAAKPTPAPVIAPDNTPMGVPPNETVTIIQP
jgi:hypothetical protein